MADVTAKMVKELRDMTGVGMMDAKRALVEVEGDIEKAVDLLREKGMAKATKDAISFTKSWNISFLETKSVSEFTSTIAAVFP